jgi:hypothetical protein
VTVDGLQPGARVSAARALFEYVTVSVTIRDNAGPSTDGIDIDSPAACWCAGNDIDNNDDTIRLKAGRDSDGLRVAGPPSTVLIRDNVARRRRRRSFGSETSGGIRHVVAWRNHGIGTTEGIRFKTAKTRGGYVSDVLVRDLRMANVPLPITFTLDWNPSYSYASFPDTMRDVPAHWRVLATRVEPAERGFCDIHDITIEDAALRPADLRASGLHRLSEHLPRDTRSPRGSGFRVCSLDHEVRRRIADRFR